MPHPGVTTGYNSVTTTTYRRTRTFRAQRSALSAQLLPFGVETTDKTLPAPVHAGRPLARRGVHSCTELYHLQILQRLNLIRGNGPRRVRQVTLIITTYLQLRTLAYLGGRTYILHGVGTGKR